MRECIEPRDMLPFGCFRTRAFLSIYTISCNSGWAYHLNSSIPFLRGEFDQTMADRVRVFRDPARPPVLPY